MNLSNNRKRRVKSRTRARVTTPEENEREAGREDQGNLVPSPGKEHRSNSRHIIDRARAMRIMPINAWVTYQGA